MPRRTAAVASNRPIDVHTTINMPETGALEKKLDDKPDFWAYMLSLTPEEWKNHIVYLTRENPKTSINGIGGYLTKLQQPFDIDDIKLAYGGYEFSFIMKKGNDLAYSGRFRVEAPPKYDPTRESSAPAAIAAPAAAAMDGSILKVLEQQNERLYQVLTTLQGAKDENPAVAAGIEILTSAYKTGLNAVSTQPSGGNVDPSKQLENVLALAERIVSVRGGGGGGILETITLLERLGIFSKPKTLAEQLTEVKTLSEMITGGGEPKDWKAAAVQTLTAHLPKILDALKPNPEVAQARANEAMARARAAENIRLLQQPGTAATPQPSIAAAAPATPIGGGGLRVVSRDTVDNPTAPAAAAPAPPAAPVELTAEEHAYAMKVNIVNLFRGGASGSSIASYIDDVNPEFAADFLKYSPQQIRLWFMGDELLKLIVDDPRFDEVLEEARSYMSETEEPAPVSH